MQKSVIISGLAKFLATILAIDLVILGVGAWLQPDSIPRKLVVSEYLYENNPVWSPNRSYIAFECGYDYSSVSYKKPSFASPNWRDEICLFDLSTGEANRLTWGSYKSHPVWSSDGSILAWHDGIRGSLVQFNIETRKRTETALGDAECDDWRGGAEYIQSEMGQTVVFYCHGLVLDLRTMNLIPARAELFDDVYSSDAIKYTELSPDGRYVAMAAYPPGYTRSDDFHGFNLIVKEGEKTIYKNASLFYSRLVWSPDSKILLIDRIIDLEKRQSETLLLYLPTRELIPFKRDLAFYSFIWGPDPNIVALMSEDALEIVQIQFSERPFSYKVIKTYTYHLPGSHDYYLAWTSDGRIALTSAEILKEDGYSLDLAAQKIWLIDWKKDSEPRLMDELYQAQEK